MSRIRVIARLVVAAVLPCELQKERATALRPTELPCTNLYIKAGRCYLIPCTMIETPTKASSLNITLWPTYFTIYIGDRASK